MRSPPRAQPYEGYVGGSNPSGRAFEAAPRRLTGGVLGSCPPQAIGALIGTASPSSCQWYPPGTRSPAGPTVLVRVGSLRPSQSPGSLAGPSRRTQVLRQGTRRRPRGCLVVPAHC